MNEREIYTKTESGREEMRTRALHLSGALRTVLLLVDGHRPVSQLKDLMSGGKAPPDALEQLLAKGLIELYIAAPPEPKPAPPPIVVAPAVPPATAPRATKYGSAPIPIAPAKPAPPAARPPNAALEPALNITTEAEHRFNRLYTIMNEIVSDYLGLRGYFMQLKIEKCSSAEELLALQEELGSAIAKAHGKDVAAELVNRIQAAA
ncbi:MAG: hypothetical protein ABSF50_01315 [Burkholderiaceae bacterium]|jgi:hypothetical protein